LGGRDVALGPVHAVITPSQANSHENAGQEALCVGEPLVIRLLGTH
jgi:hypothetical protein